MSDPIDPAATMADHQACHGCSEPDDHCLGCAGLAPWPCLPYRLASALFSEQAKVARVVEMAHRFELIPRARLLGALTAKAKP